MTAKTAMTSVLVVEDQQVLASALEIAIGIQPDLDCVGTAVTVDEALAQVAARRPDVVLMDIQLPGINGIEGTKRIKAAYPDINVLILTATVTSQRLAAAAKAGATGCLAKNCSFTDILAAIRKSIQAQTGLPSAAVNDMIEDLPETPGPAEPRPPYGRPRPGALAKLTPREQQVLALMGEGLDPGAIAERLVLSVYTARGHVKNIMMKLGAHSQLEAVVIATRAGLLPSSRKTGE